MSDDMQVLSRRHGPNGVHDFSLIPPGPKVPGLGKFLVSWIENLRPGKSLGSLPFKFGWKTGIAAFFPVDMPARFGFEMHAKINDAFPRSSVIRRDEPDLTLRIGFPVCGIGKKKGGDKKRKKEKRDDVPSSGTRIRT